MTWLADNWLILVAVLAFVGVHLLMHRGHGSHGGGAGHAGHGAAPPTAPLDAPPPNAAPTDAAPLNAADPAANPADSPTHKHHSC